jgi:ABC-type nitrate/sulfonate/bicarbonate transport system substrate-binding protein
MNPTQPIRVGGVPEHFNLPWHLAIEASVSRGGGEVVEWVDYSTGTGAMLADLAYGRLDLAVLLTEGAALGLARRLPIEAVSLYTTSPLIWGVHVPPGSGWQAVHDLRGARFAISRYGSGSHLMSLALAIEQGWRPADLKFEIVDNLPGAIAAFHDGRADAFLWEHFTTEPFVDAGEFRRVGDFVAPWPAWVLCAHQTAWRDRQAEIETLLTEVCTEARRLAAADDSALVIATRYGLSQSAVEQWLGNTEWVDRRRLPGPALAAAHEMLVQADAIG